MVKGTQVCIVCILKRKPKKKEQQQQQQQQDDDEEKEEEWDIEFGTEQKRVVETLVIVSARYCFPTSF